MAAKTNVTSTTTGCDLRSFESLFGRAEWVRPVTRWSVTSCCAPRTLGNSATRHRDHLAGVTGLYPMEAHPCGRVLPCPFLCW